MKIRKSVAGAALIGLAVFGVAACSDDNDSDSSTTTTSAAADASGVETSAAETSAADGEAAPALEAGAAQEVIVAVLSPDTDPGTYATLVDSDDPALAGQLGGLAKGFTAAGYTPDKFTVTEVTADGETTAIANVEVASPHTPEPVAMPMAFVYTDGTWKLSADAITALSSMGGGH